ncbi:phosphatase PAP2 family protein [Pseudoduganella namucuonensis]|uniref:PAP2 superfamily protein n=1 Tax=Pseudoduganella namucuonensis TaxID=1035707 RepID=A0A1I7HQ16_9BURK|nr:phosphatase PAP2 family protein [Pseudoduganella namucuonensis]SFU62818.1 PAP2 superfamily protein [Pseudoduganella namucuonensis]
MMMWQGLSALGSLAVTGPLGVAIAVWLLAGKSWRMTLAWCGLFGAGMGLVVATKVAFIGWGVGSASLEFAGISGHAMRASAVFPVTAWLATRNAGDPWRQAALAAGVLLALMIGVSRVPVLAHSASEVVAGCMLGLLVAAAFIWSVRTEEHAVLGRLLAALCIPAVLILPRVEPLPTEMWMTRLALVLSGRDQPFTRQHWHHAPPPVQGPQTPF